MTYIAIAELLVIVALAVVLERLARTHAAHLERLEQSHREERFELQERIRVPDRKPLPRIPRSANADDPRDRPSDLTSLAQIGSVVPARDPEAS